MPLFAIQLFRISPSIHLACVILFEFLELIFCFFLQGHFVTSSALLVCVSFCRMCTFDLHPLQSCHQLIELLKSLLHLCNPSQHVMVNYLKSFHLTIFDVLFPISFSFRFSIIHSGSSSLQKTCYQSRTKVLIQKGKEFEYLGHFNEQHEIHELLK